MNSGFSHRLSYGLAAASLLVTSGLFPNSVLAGGIDAAIKAGSLGVGLELGYTFEGSNFSFRLQGNDFDYDYTLEEDDIEYDTTLDLASVGFLVDWHPFSGAFRFTLGVYEHENKIYGTSSGEGVYEIGDITYVVDSNDNFLLEANIDLGDGLAPYAGIGWGHSPTNDTGLLLSLDIGVLYQGAPEVDLQASGNATANGFTIDVGQDPTAQAQVQEEEDNLEDDLSQFDLYPVITFGIGYRF